MEKREMKKPITKKPKNEKKQRLSSGIPNFDSLIQGGFEKDSINLIVGSLGTGKTIFATQFLVDGMKKGEKCLYVTFEEKKEQFYKNMKKLGWDLQDYEKKGLFIFLEYTPSKVKTMLDEGGGAIETEILRNKITRIVIDSITSFELLFETELAKREASLALFGMIREWNCTCLLTYEQESDSNYSNSNVLEFETDSIIKLNYLIQKNKRIRCLEILKMRGTKHSEYLYPFEITSKGIIVKKKHLKRKYEN